MKKIPRTKIKKGGAAKQSSHQVDHILRSTTPTNRVPSVCADKRLIILKSCKN